MKKYDYIVIGAGTTGCIMASRLSENQDIEVLLLEAGAGFVGTSKPKELENSNLPVVKGFNWDFEANIHTKTIKSLSQEMQRAASILTAASGKLNMMKASLSNMAAGKNIISKFQYPMAKVVGGGSTVNGAMAVVPSASDFQEWTTTGLDGWQWSRMESIFDKLLFSSQGSPLLNIELYDVSELCPVQRDFYKTAISLGHPETNLVDAAAPGIGIIPKNTIEGRRQSVDITHLLAAQARPNLTVMTNCTVEKIIFDKKDSVVAATGVDVFINGKAVTLQANNVVLSAGTINSPAVLMRSGVGNIEQLRSLDIPQVLDLPGVGKNLIDHPSVSIWAEPKQGAAASGEPVHQVMLRLANPLRTAAASDLQLFMMGALSTKMLPPLDKMVDSELVNGVSVMLGKPSSRGYIKLRSRSADTAPSININCLDNRDDLNRMKLGVLRAWDICQHPTLNKHFEKYVMWNQQVIDSDKLLENMIQTTVRASMHPVGTLKMGPVSDPEAVTDENGKLYGCNNVTVADASIMPTITTVPPNITCMAIGEKLASHHLHRYH